MTDRRWTRTRRVLGPWYRRYRLATASRDQRRLEADLDRRLEVAPPVVVFQMGKVASSTIHESLRRAYPGVVVHAHQFFRRHPDPVVARLAQELHSGRPYRFVSPVRLPIERNVSDFFENYKRYVGVDFAGDRERTPSELADLFLQREPHEFPATWFDETLRPSIGIDVYAEPFDATGWATYQRGPVQLLVLRAELPDADKAQVVAHFTGLERLPIRAANRGSGKRYGAAYRDFLRTVRFPPEFVEQMCGTRYFETFYGEEYRRRTIGRWSAGGGT